MVDIIFGGKRISPLPQEKKKETKPRKPSKRYKNKKHNIKFPLSNEEEKILKYKALEHNLSVTAFSNMIIKNELSKSNIFENHEYDEKGKLMNVCLEEEYYKKIQRLSIEWNIPQRRVIHRIMKNYIMKVSTRKIISSEGVIYYKGDNQ